MGQPVRILHILQRMEAGGTQALLMNIYRKIDRSKIQFDFLVVYKEEQFYDDEIKELGGRIFKLTFRDDLNLMKFQNDLSAFFIHHRDYDIVHCHAYTFGYFCLKAAKKAGIPIRIAHSHSNGTAMDIKYPLKRIMQKLFSIHATDFMACSKEAGLFLFEDKKFVILNNAINIERFVAKDQVRQNVREALNVTNNFVIGHVGRFHRTKNHLFLMDVFEKILHRKSNAILLLVGSGPLEKEIKKKVQDKQLMDHVIFLGNSKDVNIILQAMEVFILPSFFEGLGIVAIEAQAAGIPTVCSEGLPPEANISPLYRQLSLDKGSDKWADIVLQIANSKYAHTNMSAYVKKAGFDIDSVTQKIQDYYLKRIEYIG